jgi:hypothetical protein
MSGIRIYPGTNQSPKNTRYILLKIREIWQLAAIPSLRDNKAADKMIMLIKRGPSRKRGIGGDWFLG